jgi:bifunctional oligoribonuclease and PAP phosphatase NrnA
MKLKTKLALKASAKRKTDPFKEVVRLIKSHQSFLITTHVTPDGDGLGAESALFLALRKLGKKVQIVNHDPLPHRFSYLAFAPHYRSSDNIPPHEVCFVLDAGDFSRIREGVRREEFGTLVNIDHHYSNDHYGDYNLVLPEAAATGEVVYRLIQALKVKMDKGIAEGVYTSIVTDTGRFRYSNTTPHIFRLAAELEEAGADICHISEHIFGDISREAMELNRLALASVQVTGDGSIGSMTLTRGDFLKSGASDDDTENLINVVRNLDTVKIAIFMKERADGQIKLSLRSKNGVNVAEVAKLFRGGGHAYAAGAVLSGPLEKALQEVLRACQATLK